MNTRPTSSDRSDKYEVTFSEFGESPKSLQWQDYRSAAIRYRQLVTDLEIYNKTILDAGCGMGDLIPYLYAKSDNFKYLGVDVTKPFIDVARKRYEGHDFELKNPFEDKFESKFDIVISSGVLNSTSENWLESRKEMIKELFELSQEVLAFNMAGSFQPIKPTDKVSYAPAMEIFKYCITLTPKVILRSNYHAKDFTVLMYH